MTENSEPSDRPVAAWRVVVVDDHAMFRSGVRHDIGSRVQIVGEAEDVPTAVAASLATTGQLVICEVCGCYLMMAPDELETCRRQIEDAKAERLKKIRKAASTLV
ncbi:MAG: hypothetical protein REI45_05375 [Propionicimonas sp.]|nr:hypothetical protein [Propionicimonas sp.]